ncbi:hypothetical protein ALC62_09414, partial [Cyphomyrmex costatus]
NKLVRPCSRTNNCSEREREKENETLGSMTRNEFFFGQVDEEEGKDGRSAEGKRGNDARIDCHCTRYSRKTRPERKKRVGRT